MLGHPRRACRCMESLPPTLLDYLARAAIPAAVLAVFVTVIAYIHSARLKVLVFSTPVPFTCAFVMLYLDGRQQVNATFLSGLALSAAYHWVVYLMRARMGLPLMLAIGVSAGLYVVTASQMRFAQGLAYPWALALFAAAWLAALWWHQPRHEEGQRATAPWPLKLSCVFVLALGIFSLTDLLAGAVTTFPYAGVFTSYEMRRCLRTLAGQYMINIAAFAAMITTIWAVQTWTPLPGLWPLLPGWLAVAASLWLIYRLGLGRPTTMRMAVPAGVMIQPDDQRAGDGPN